VLTLHWAPKSTGKFRQTATLISSDPNQPEFDLVVKGMVYPPLVTMPEEPIINFAQVSNEEEQRLPLAVTSFDEPDFKIIEVVSTNPKVVTAAEPQALSEDERRELKFSGGYRVDIVLHPSEEIGSFNEMLIIKTDHSGENELQVPVQGKRTGAISAIPELVS